LGRAALRAGGAGRGQTISLLEEAVQDQITNGFLWQQMKLWVNQVPLPPPPKRLGSPETVFQSPPPKSLESL